MLALIAANRLGRLQRPDAIEAEALQNATDGGRRDTTLSGPLRGGRCGRSARQAAWQAIGAPPEFTIGRSGVEHAVRVVQAARIRGGTVIRIARTEAKQQLPYDSRLGLGGAGRRAQRDDRHRGGEETVHCRASLPFKWNARPPSPEYAVCKSKPRSTHDRKPSPGVLPRV